MRIRTNDNLNDIGECVDMDENKPEIDLNQMPEAMEQFYRTIVDACKKYYSDPENMRKYEEWNEKRKHLQSESRC